MRTYNDYAQLAFDNGLHCGHVTGGNNGYPSPYFGAFIYGFDNYQEAQNFLDANGGSMVICKKRDGWNVWQKHGETSRPLTAEDYLQDLGDNYSTITQSDVFQELDNLQRDISPAELHEELARLAYWAEELETASECDETVIINPMGETERVSNNLMRYNEDVWTWNVGVFFDRDAEPQDEE